MTTISSHNIRNVIAFVIDTFSKRADHEYPQLRGDLDKIAAAVYEKVKFFEGGTDEDYLANEIERAFKPFMTYQPTEAQLRVILGA